MPAAPPSGLDRLNDADPAAAADLLRAVCAASGWARAVLDGRPYPDAAALLAASDAVTAALDADDLAEALAGHPAIGRPAPGEPVSAREQRGMTGAPRAVRDEMLELDLAYQERFGHVFLICASGLSGTRMRDAAAARLANTPEQEERVVRTELAAINRLRLTRLVEGDPS